MRQRRGLGDLVPVVLNGSVLKMAGQRLVCGRAAGDPQCFDQVEGVGVPVARQFWRPVRTKLVCGLQGKRSERDQLVNCGSGEKFGGVDW